MCLYFNFDTRLEDGTVVPKIVSASESKTTDDGKVFKPALFI